MYTFPELLKQIRSSANLTQTEFAEVVNVSPVLIAMVESGQKEVSKKLLVKVANALGVHPASITPFLYASIEEGQALSELEKRFVKIGAKLQEYLIKNRAKRLKKNAEKIPQNTH